MKSVVTPVIVEFIEDFIALDHPSLGIIPFQPYDAQEELIDNFNCNRFNIIKKSRQVGITSVALGYILARVLHHGLNVRHNYVVAGHNASKRNDLFDQFFNMFDGIDFDVWGQYPNIKPSRVNSSITFLETGDIVRFVNANEPNCLRGLGINFAYIDEFAFVGQREQSSFITTMTACLASDPNSEMIIASTPSGANDEFAKMWDLSCQGATGFHPSKVMMSQGGPVCTVGTVEDGTLVTLRDPIRAYEFAMSVL